ncbi:acyl-CoA dehydratase activase-related protein [Denitrovibrio acetiphilus]|jgi:predicted CoA-substrate-specific enzyme activase|nr:acyl-CoA dehydratase activase-related protein [Denitrovibrio acetiphilus]
MSMNKFHLAGIDIGSTTAKAVIIDENGKTVFKRYVRHQTKTIETLRGIFTEAFEELGDVLLDLKVTGSAGMGIAESLGLPFIQEVVASAQYIKKNYPECKTFIEIGGEDSKIVFFDENFMPDIRMNGTCAGGTGAFIDQMAVLLNVDVSEMNSLAEKSSETYPIASRCGVFAKTDIQALLSQHVSAEDIAASVFHAVAAQFITALSHGREIKPKILFGGGPLSFYPALRGVFAGMLNIGGDSDIIIPSDPELIPAVGTAIAYVDRPCLKNLSELLSLIVKSMDIELKEGTKRLAPLFKSETEFNNWSERHKQYKVKKTAPSESIGKDLYMGIDSGSTTTKVVIIDDEGKLVLSHYGPNHGDPIDAVNQGLKFIKNEFDNAGVCPHIVRSAVTGYGESLIKVAFDIDDGVVETIAHFRAARFFEPDVSFILDIGGQDMKAIFIQNHAVSEIHVNEACSSGCGSFIETFAQSLGYNVQEFAAKGCESHAPFDLGTRCTVFMNSKVKQALRERADVADISAGLAYSVIKNSLYKVLKLKNNNETGDKILAQGGTFKNPAVLKALEALLEKEVIRPDISELMGAYGSALSAHMEYHRLKDSAAVRNALQNQSKNAAEEYFALSSLEAGSSFTKKEFHCSGCENKCKVFKLIFDNGNHFFTGNRCERYFSNDANADVKGTNLVEEQVKLLFDRNTEPEGKPVLTYGIPRCLNMYENYPFWCTFLTSCGFKVVLSSVSNFRLYEKGLNSVMSENICFPAKLAHGHIIDLADKKVDRIFYPTVIYEHKEYEDALNSYNCPVVTGYPDLLKNAINPKKKFNIPLDKPVVSFNNTRLLKDQLFLFFRKFGVSYSEVSKGVEKGLVSQDKYKEELRLKTKNLIENADINGRTVVVLAGRPYHVDPLINHGCPELLAEMGVDVISEAAASFNNESVLLGDINVLTQWSYSNRLYAAAEWVTKNKNAQMVQVTSFGCGPDAVSSDEVKKILYYGGKVHTLLKMDEIANLGAVKIRLRSMLEAVKEGVAKAEPEVFKKVEHGRVFLKNDRVRTIIAPYFSRFYSPLIPAAFRPLGYKVEVLPPQDVASVELGLKSINNDMCYPAILIAGDIIKAFQTGGYDPQKTAVLLTQTGGQCRASAYVSLIKKGLASAGLNDIPVITVSNQDINYQPGFEIDSSELFKRLALGIVFADQLVKMYLTTVVREKIAGTAKLLHEKYLLRMEEGVEKADYHNLLNILKEAVDEFNSVEVDKSKVPRVGIVGEIFVKHNIFSNGHILDWLTSQGIECDIPPLLSFFSQRFINETYDQNSYLKRSFKDRIKYSVLEMFSGFYLMQIDKVMRGYRFYRKPKKLRQLSEITGKVTSLANQSGEGWLLTAEMISMLSEGTNNIICLQPFGCISNHITGKGVEMQLKEMFPSINFLAIDMDAGSSEINILNRLHLIVNAAKEQTSCKTAMADIQKHDRNQWLSSYMSLHNFYAFSSDTSLKVEKWRAWVSKLPLWEKIKEIKYKIE